MTEEVAKTPNDDTKPEDNKKAEDSIHPDPAGEGEDPKQEDVKPKEESKPDDVTNAEDPKAKKKKKTKTGDATEKDKDEDDSDDKSDELEGANESSSEDGFKHKTVSPRSSKASARADYSIDDVDDDDDEGMYEIERDELSKVESWERYDEEEGQILEEGSHESTAEDEEEKTSSALSDEIALPQAQEKLDREKLLQALKAAEWEKRREERKNYALNKMVTSYFRRKKLVRALQKDDVNHLQELLHSYGALLTQLDELKAREDHYLTKSNEKEEALIKEKKSLAKLCKENIEKVNALMREVGLVTQSSKTGQLLPLKVIERYLRKMNNIRNRISEERTLFINVQDKMANVTTKGKEFEVLTEGLSISDFAALKAEVEILNDKLNELKSELEQLRRRYNYDSYTIAHLSEKHHILEHRIVIQKNRYLMQQGEEDRNRNHMNAMKRERDLIHKKLNTKKFELGLLNKPALLRDFVRSRDRAEELRAILVKSEHDDEVSIEEFDEDDFSEEGVNEEEGAMYESEIESEFEEEHISIKRKTIPSILADCFKYREKKGQF